MKTSIIQIGNSKGLRLSKQVLEQYHITDEVELIFEKDQIVLRPIQQPRKGWDNAFKEMAKEGDDKLLIDDVLAEEDFDEWN
ncbi:AbrB/MazE/SpoVT family DNA-binding domain-containing protein [Imperialibacter roseus]|uniref:AbrB/MazE/SpoVT family DNA-binding domain-containing protein n=1 Tax=Imperialibacter roseus TaxID=1324217 RepID=A0ABZ0ITR9_9BACT|nr:AbrB/MazE/SpoVT family DNA-binding domain-containing protein [Imperialibacter roseus]WOK07790.1 AbrB/MazE/SpoVT family DNA-binding domain-containing protein [Imperialibacter roseus]|tara:strand:+ start:21288 stop:21533 length:246 start_codon:yes stop_codon:yes gene_type:complete